MAVSVLIDMKLMDEGGKPTPLFVRLLRYANLAANRYVYTREGWDPVADMIEFLLRYGHPDTEGLTDEKWLFRNIGRDLYNEGRRKIEAIDRNVDVEQFESEDSLRDLLLEAEEFDGFVRNHDHSDHPEYADLLPKLIACRLEGKTRAEMMQALGFTKMSDLVNLTAAWTKLVLVFRDRKKKPKVTTTAPPAIAAWTQTQAMAVIVPEPESEANHEPNQSGSNDADK